MKGNLAKMKAELGSTIDYQLPVGDDLLPLNGLLGKPITLNFSGTIHCVHCSRKTNKSFNQGFCYPCFKKLAQCDQCIVSPEKCHFHLGTCREPEWGETHCFIEHIVYLSNTSKPKVGITRHTQVPTRWIDQGAVAALPIFTVQSRLQSGKVEHVFKDHIADKTNWRNMLKGVVDDVDLGALRDELFAATQSDVTALQDEYGVQAIQHITDGDLVELNFPVLEYPTKVVSLNPEKTPDITGTLMGIKGQYLILDIGVINIRKHGGYEVEVIAG